MIIIIIILDDNWSEIDRCRGVSFGFWRERVKKFCFLAIAIRLSFVNIYNNISFNIVIFVYNVV